MYTGGRDGRVEPKHEPFEGHRRLVVLDDAATEAHDYIVAAMQQWLARGDGGWLLGAAHPVQASFWSRVWRGNRLHASSPPAGTAVLEGPSHGWEVAF